MFDELEEQPEMNCIISSGVTLDNITKILGNEVVNPILDFI